MNDYGFDYMNYITNIPSNMNYNQKNKKHKLKIKRGEKKDMFYFAVIK